MATVQLNIHGTDQSGSSFKSAVNNVQSLDNSVDKLTSRVTALAGAMGALYIGNKLWEGFTLGIKAVDDFQQSVIKTAAMITSLQGGENVAESYRLAKEYAEGLQNTLMKVDANTSLNLTSLQSITEEMVKQGIVLDGNNADQVEGFTRLANAAAVYSNNGRNEIQLRQEVRALMMGQVDQNSQLASIVQKMVQGPLQEQVEKWKQSGTLVVELGKALSGFGPASKDMANTWSAVKSSLETSVNLILRAGFGEIVQDIVGYVGKLNDYLKENKDMIGGEIKKGWEEFKTVAATVADIAKTIYNNFEPFAAIFIGGALIKGIGSAVSLMKDLLAVATAARAVMLATGMITGGAAVAGAAGAAGTAVAGGAVAGGGLLATMGGAALGSYGAIGAGVGLGYMAQPLVRWADKKLYQGTGFNLTGEAMYDESQVRASEADKNYNTMMAKRRPGASGPATPVIAQSDTEEQYKKKIHAQEQELVAFRAMQDSKTAIEKHTGEVALADLKQRYALGKITTQEYYDAENKISNDSAYEKYSNAVDYYNKEVDLLDAIAARKGEKSAEYLAEQAKSTKADEAVQIADLEMQKVTIDGETKVQEALLKRGEIYAGLIAKSQEEAGQYVEAANTRIAAEQKTVEYLRMSAEERALKDQEFSRQRTAASDKVLDEIKKYTDANRTLQDELDVLMGKDKALVQAENELGTGRDKLLSLERLLRDATASNNTIAIAGLSQQIALTAQLNAFKERAKTLSEQRGVLSGTIVGFNGNTPIYANGYQQQQAATGYQSPSDGGVPASDNYWAAQPYSVNYQGARAGGGDVSAYATYRINEDGTEWLSMGSKGGYITPSGQTPPGQNTGFSAPITIQGGLTFNLPNVTNQTTAKELARQVMPELQKLQQRYRKAA